MNEEVCYVDMHIEDVKTGELKAKKSWRITKGQYKNLYNIIDAL